MFTGFSAAIFILWAMSAFIDYGDFCYLWQLKEYRWDRLRDFFSTKQGRNYWLKYPILWRSLAALLLFFWPINSVLTIKSILIGFFIIDLGIQIFRWFKKNVRRPVYTKKAILIIFISMIFEWSVFLFDNDWTALFLLIILRFFIITAVVGVMSYPTALAKRHYIKLARDKILRNHGLLVIGITGSYGKTSVKESLANILAAQYRVLKTPEHTNTEIGIAKFILAQNLADKDMFVVEMGAYTEGEIKAICEMVRPKIGILTAINEQHLSLFGGIENIQKAKYELLRALPKDGLAVVNADNKYCREYLDGLSCEIKTFGFDAEFKPDCLILGGKERLSKTACGFNIGKQHIDLYSTLLGYHVCYNLAPCLLVALHLGVDLDTIGAQCINQEPLPQTMQLFKYGRSIIIDDSYNSNPAGFKSALDLLSSFPSHKKRIVVTRGMLELGEKSFELHEQVGGDIAFCADELILINRDYEEPLGKGMAGDKYRTKIVVKDNPNELLGYIRKFKHNECVILLENRVPENVYKEVTAEGKVDRKNL